MSTELLSVQSFEKFCYQGSELDAKMASEISTLYGTQDGWNPQFHDTYMMPSTHAPFSIPTVSLVRKNIPTTFDSHTVYSSHSAFMATSTMLQTQDSATVSPLQSRFAPNDSSPPPAHTSPTFDISDVSQSPNFEQSQHIAPPCSLPTDSSQSSLESQRPSTRQRSAGRKRKSETVEAGTPRAIYLEKNRKAASKCRSKQKQQQEYLVEEARSHERRNKLLKAEVEILRGDLQNLMEIVGQHTTCPDSRLLTYVQREADRLAAGESSSRQFGGDYGMSPDNGRHISPAALSPPIGLR